MLWTIERMDRSRPPGVFSWRISAWEPSARARSSAASRSRTVIGVMAPSISIRETGSTAAAGGPGQASATATRSIAWPARRRRRFIATSARMIARAPRRLLAEGEDRDQLEEQVGGEETGDLTGAVVGRRH